MAAWSLLVWAAGLLLLSPLSAFVLGNLLGSDGVISNEEVVSWLITPRGLVFLLLALASALTLSVAQFGGMFRLITTDRARTATIGRAAMALTTGLPAVFRFCLATVAAAVVLLAPLLLWVAFLYARFLREHDINYYLSAKPPVFYQALLLAAPVAVIWAIGAIWVVVRLLPALPAFFDGHRPARRAAVVGWRASSGRFRSLLTRLGGAALIIAAARAALAGTIFLAASTIVDRIAAASMSLRPVIAATAVAGALAGAVDVIVTFLGFAWLAALLSRFYEETADGISRASAAPIPTLANALLTRAAARRARRWRPAGQRRRDAGDTRKRVRSPEFLVIAHRAGALYAPRKYAARARAGDPGARRHRRDRRPAHQGWRGRRGA